MSAKQWSAAKRKAKKMGIGSRKRQILLCGDTRTAKCASKKAMRTAWQHLKKRLKQVGLGGSEGVLRTRAYCLGVCRGGPIMVVLPDGTWYGRCTPDVIDRIVEEHLIGGYPVEEYVLAQAPFAIEDSPLEA